MGPTVVSFSTNNTNHPPPFPFLPMFAPTPPPIRRHDALHALAPLSNISDPIQRKGIGWCPLRYARVSIAYPIVFIPLIKIITSITPTNHEGADCASPLVLALGPNMLGIGFRLALTTLILGTPWMTLGSLRKVGSSFAGVRVVMVV